MSNLVKVKRLNKTLNIDEGRLDSYLLDGYDQIDEEGNVITRATGGRNVSLAEYNKALDEKDELEKENKKLKSEVAKLKKEAAAK
ncbi:MULTISPECIES: hypothetical protein [Bacillus]|jgi:hypothetical protein|uniref:Uncharacterized protein n=1 Tax=Bacillus paranthracis TaxID=2026186 RepID=A0A7D8H2W8_9BACI|nr:MULTISPECIES: hypothetical protein [Bacillus]ANT40241.1 hypothetical protein [Bacillus phage PfNC7401]ANT40310.1 hypothetical protein [Bacillus phage PfIS075]EEK97196.1 hypothetical protein bcere0013_56840 [Bacillus cereus BDRD-ST26]EJP82587.1 hypothetical protein IAU_05803 [Bacillus cereus IS075]EOO82207.1 hypothetical protein IGS_05970 [Bacillus cereus IS845/00]EOO95327.1 hypothetical protein IGQ_04086 [Bacillus cereus IS195]